MAQKGSAEHFLDTRYKVEGIWINIESYSHFIDNHLEYLSKHVSAGILTNEQVIRETTELIRQVGELIPQDLANISQCVKFISDNYPHAVFGSYQDSIDIGNLSSEQMIECLQQEGLKFDYARVDENGNIPLEDI